MERVIKHAVYIRLYIIVYTGGAVTGQQRKH